VILVYAARIFHGLTMTELRILAYNLTVVNKIDTISLTWSEHKTAGIEFAQGFKDRYGSHMHKLV